MAKPQAKKRKSSARPWFSFLWEASPSRLPAWAFIAALILFIGIFSFRHLGCLDTGFHIKTGEWVHQHRSIPLKDPFSYTAAGQPWISHEWLFGLIAFYAFQSAGVGGVIGLKTLLIGILFALTAWVAHRRGAKPGWIALALVSAYVVARGRFQERPEILSLPISVSYLLVYEISRKSRKWILLLPVLQMIWTNAHGGTALLGWALAGAFVVKALKESYGSPLHESLRRCRLELLALGLTVAVSVASPNAIQSLTYGLLRVHSPMENEEFRSLATAVADGFNLSLVIFLIWSAVLGCLLALRWKKARLYELLLFPALLIISISFFRFSSLFSFLLAPALAFHLSDRPFLGKMRWWIPVGIAACLLARVVTTELESSSTGFGAGYVTKVLPVRSAEFIKANDLQGHMFNEYAFGGYLLWSLWPGRQVYIDGREDVYIEPGILKEYLDVFTDRERWENLVARRDIDYAVVKYPEAVPNSEEQSPEKLAFDRTRWALVQFDDAAVIYVRRNGRNDEVIRRYEIKAVQPLQLSSYLDGVLADPARLSLFLSEVSAALREQPDSFRLHFLMGMFYVKRGGGYLNQAMEEFRLCTESNPQFVPSYLNWGGILMHLGRKTEAEEAYRRALFFEPKNALARQQLETLGK
jgi:hypothetical protein